MRRARLAAVLPSLLVLAVFAVASCTGTITGANGDDLDDFDAAPGGADADLDTTPDAGLEPDADTTPVIPMPRIDFVISDGLFSESEVRPGVEAGTAVLLQRLAANIEVIPGAVIPDLTIHYSASGNSYCSGIAYLDSTEIACPYGYPIVGDNQNYVRSITVHEIGHLVAHALIAPGSARDRCVNEGLATWLAGPYWANYQSQSVGSLREAARREIAAGRITATLDTCVSASDAWYKLYGSLIEFAALEPGRAGRLSRGEISRFDLEAEWAAWLAE